MKIVRRVVAENAEVEIAVTGGDARKVVVIAAVVLAAIEVETALETEVAAIGGPAVTGAWTVRPRSIWTN